MGIKYETEFGSHFVSGKELLKLPPATLVEYGVYSNRIDTLTRALATLRMICLEPDINEWKRVRRCCGRQRGGGSLRGGRGQDGGGGLRLQGGEGVVSRHDQCPPPCHPGKQWWNVHKNVQSYRRCW